MLLIWSIMDFVLSMGGKATTYQRPSFQMIVKSNLKFVLGDKINMLNVIPFLITFATLGYNVCLFLFSYRNKEEFLRLRYRPIHL